MLRHGVVGSKTARSGHAQACLEDRSERSRAPRASDPVLDPGLPDSQGENRAQPWPRARLDAHPPGARTPPHTRARARDRTLRSDIVGFSEGSHSDYFVSQKGPVGTLVGTFVRTLVQRSRMIVRTLVRTTDLTFDLTFVLDRKEEKRKDRARARFSTSTSPSKSTVTLLTEGVAS